MKKICLFVMMFGSLCFISCSKNAKPAEEQQAEETVVVAEEAAPAEEVIDESDPRYYDHIMDLYEKAVKENDLEVIAATTENLAMAQFEGLLTPEQEKRWAKLAGE